MPRLSRATCKTLGYDPSRLEIGIVHLGVGAFHRAHMADYTDEVLRKGDLRWGIIGASLRSPDTRDALAPQDYLYTLAESDEAGERCRVIGGAARRARRAGRPAGPHRRHVPSPRSRSCRSPSPRRAIATIRPRAN